MPGLFSFFFGIVEGTRKFNREIFQFQLKTSQFCIKSANSLKGRETCREFGEIGIKFLRSNALQALQKQAGRARIYQEISSSKMELIRRWNRTQVADAGHPQGPVLKLSCFLAAIR